MILLLHILHASTTDARRPKGPIGERRTQSLGQSCDGQSRAFRWRFETEWEIKFPLAAMVSNPVQTGAQAWSTEAISADPPSPSASSPSSSVVLSPSSKLSLSSDLSNASPQHVYRRASQYFLTKHFPEASAAVQPLLRSADRKWQQKAWALYLVVLDNGLKLSDEDGRKLWGRQAWENQSSVVKGSKLWDDLLDSVGDSIGDLDPDIIMAMLA
jgi:hypothetical protein